MKKELEGMHGRFDGNEFTVNGTKWVFIGAGSYNRAYKSNTGLVLKIPQASEYDKPERAVEIWNQINIPKRFKESEKSEVPEKAGLSERPKKPEKSEEQKLAERYQATLYMDEKNQVIGWVAPFINGDQTTDENISAALIRIYAKTGRIVLDANTSNNFLTNKDGTFCVDVSFAILRHAGDSMVSLDAWKKLKKKFHEKLNTTSRILTAATIKALLLVDELLEPLNKKLQGIQDKALIDAIENLKEARIQGFFSKIKETTTTKQNLHSFIKALAEDYDNTLKDKSPKRSPRHEYYERSPRDYSYQRSSKHSDYEQSPRGRSSPRSPKRTPYEMIQDEVSKLTNQVEALQFSFKQTAKIDESPKKSSIKLARVDSSTVAPSEAGEEPENIPEGKLLIQNLPGSAPKYFFKPRDKAQVADPLNEKEKNSEDAIPDRQITKGK